MHLYKLDIPYTPFRRQVAGKSGTMLATAIRIAMFIVVFLILKKGLSVV